MSGAHTEGPWGVEQTKEMLWVGPMRPDGHKVDSVVVGLNIDGNLTVEAALRQYRNARLIAAAPEMLEAGERLIAVFDQQRMTNAERIIAGISDAGLKTEGNAAITALRAAIAKATSLRPVGDA